MTESVNSRLAQPLSAATTEMLRHVANRTTGLIVLCGFPASGKTTATKYLAEVLDPVVLDKDSFAPQLEESVMAELTGNPHDRDSDTYTRVVAPHIYSALARTAFAVARHCPVVIDAPFLGYIRAAAEQGITLSDHLRRIASASDASISTIWLATNPDHIRDRMRRRGALRDQSKLENWADYRGSVLDSGLDHIAKSVVDHVVPN